MAITDRDLWQWKNSVLKVPCAMQSLMVMRDRILEIDPDAEVEVRKCVYLPENAQEFDFNEYSYVVF